MTSIDLAATSSRPRTTGPPTWPTRHGEACLTQAWRGQRSYGRPNTGKVAKVDITQRQARLAASTTDGMVRCSGMGTGDSGLEEMLEIYLFALWSKWTSVGVPERFGEATTPSSPPAPSLPPFLPTI
ncbi:hypothetical protein BHM03_00007028 [Ensete ventricosum]|nr:hypothetical protein BHM03_00007028 [Ensete ventricosum]